MPLASHQLQQLVLLMNDFIDKMYTLYVSQDVLYELCQIQVYNCSFFQLVSYETRLRFVVGVCVCCRLYNPADYEHLAVSPEVKELFQYISRSDPDIPHACGWRYTVKFSVKNYIQI